MTFAQDWWNFQHQKSQWEDDFTDLLIDGEDYDKIGTDDYDGSIEIYKASDDWRLTAPQQEFLRSAGFAKVYVNHNDKWQSHYSFGPDSILPVRAWRRRYVEDSTAETTNVLCGEPNPGYFEISHWPNGWDSPKFKEWLDTGYMRIVPDPIAHP